MNPPSSLSPAETIYESVKKTRRAMIRRALKRAAKALEEAAFYTRIDHPEGGIFIEGDGTINALAQLDETKLGGHCRSTVILESARFEKASIGVGAW